jgi:hypothetical protein
MGHSQGPGFQGSRAKSLLSGYGWLNEGRIGSKGVPYGPTIFRLGYPAEAVSMRNGVATPYRSQVASDVQESAPANVCSLWPQGISHVILCEEKGHGAVADGNQGLIENGSKSVARAVLVLDEFMQPSLISAPRGAASSLDGAMHEAGSNSVDDGVISSNVTWPRSDVEAAS